MLYTHAWGLFFGAGAVLALIPIWLASEDRRGLVRDAVMAFVGAGDPVPALAAELHLPGDPHRRAVGAAAPLRRPGPDLARPAGRRPDHGRARLAAVIVGLAPLFTRRYRRTRDGTMMWTLIALPAGTLLIAWLASQITPAFVSRYFAPVLAAILLLAAWGGARSGVVGLVVIVLSLVFMVHISSYAPHVQERHARHRRRAHAAAAPRRPGRRRAARVGAAGLVLPAGGPAATRRTIGRV